LEDTPNNYPEFLQLDNWENYWFWRLKLLIFLGKNTDAPNGLVHPKGTGGGKTTRMDGGRLDIEGGESCADGIFGEFRDTADP